MLKPNEYETFFLTDLMSDLSLKLDNADPPHHNIDDNDTWIDIIHIDNCNTTDSYDLSLLIFPSRHEIISETIDVFY